MQEVQVQSLGQKIPQEMATHSSILAGKIPWTESLVGYSLWDYKELDPTELATHCCADYNFDVNASNF